MHGKVWLHGEGTDGLCLEEFTTWKYKSCVGRGCIHRNEGLTTQEESGNEKGWVTGKEWATACQETPCEFQTFLFCLIGVWVGGDQLNRTKKRQGKRGKGISGCGEEKREQACDKEEGRDRERCGGEMDCNNQQWERIIKNHGCLSDVKPLLPLLCQLHCQTGSSL